MSRTPDLPSAEKRPLPRLDAPHGDLVTPDPDPKTAPMSGTVRWFNIEKGFGFIDAADGRDVFVRQTSVNGEVSLSRDQHVRFRVTRQVEGLVAHDVQPL